MRKKKGITDYAEQNINFAAFKKVKFAKKFGQLKDNSSNRLEKKLRKDENT